MARFSMLLAAALLAASCGSTPAEKMLKAARQGESVAPYWMGGTVKTELFNVTAWETLSSRSLEEVADPLRQQAIVWAEAELSARRDELKGAETAVSSIADMISKAEPMLATLQANAPPPPASNYFGNTQPDPRTAWNRQVSTAQNALDSLRNQKVSAEQHASEARHAIAESEARLVWYRKPVKGGVVRVRVNSTNKGGSPILNTWTVVYVDTPEGQRITALYDEKDDPLANAAAEYLRQGVAQSDNEAAGLEADARYVRLVGLPPTP